MDPLQDLVGRRFKFQRQASGTLVPVQELPSATWQHADGTIQSVPLPDRPQTRSLDMVDAQDGYYERLRIETFFDWIEKSEEGAQFLSSLEDRTITTKHLREVASESKISYRLLRFIALLYQDRRIGRRSC